MSDEQPRYGFEDPPQVESRRTRELARKDIATLLVRLGRKPDEIETLLAAPEIERPLLRYALDVPMNIAWYERAKIRAAREQRIALAGVIALGLGALTISTVVPRFAAEHDVAIATGQITLFLGLAYGVLQVVAAVTDQKAKLAGFCKASADLKEALFTFEDNWRGKPVADGGKLAADFASALLQETAGARRIAREERDAFFTGLKSPTDVTAALGSAVEAVGRGAQTVADLRGARAAQLEGTASARLAVVDDMRRQLIAAKASELARARKLELLRAAGAPADQIDAAKAEALQAEIDRVEAQARLDMSVKGEMLNPA
jgi:hypothetical protein